MNDDEEEFTINKWDSNPFTFGVIYFRPIENGPSIGSIRTEFDLDIKYVGIRNKVTGYIHDKLVFEEHCHASDQKITESEAMSEVERTYNSLSEHWRKIIEKLLSTIVEERNQLQQSIKDLGARRVL